MKLKDLSNYLVYKAQLYYRTEDESRTRINIGEPCYIHRLPEEMLELEVELIAPRDIFTLGIQVDYKGANPNLPQAEV